MTQYQVPISPIPFQELSVVLDDQNCVIALRQIAQSIYCDLTVDDTVVFQGRICETESLINQYPSRYFRGQLYFVDTKGSANPQYEGLNSRWLLVYASDDSDE